MKISKKNIGIALLASSISLFVLIPILIKTKNKNKNILYILGALASVQAAVGSFVLSGIHIFPLRYPIKKHRKKNFFGFDKNEFEVFSYDEAECAEDMVFSEINKKAVASNISSSNLNKL